MRTVADKSKGNSLLRVLIYGTPKTKKTWWACQAAESGKRIHLLDADDGWHVAKNLSPEAQKNIFLTQLVDKPELSVAANFLSRMFKQKHFFYNQDTYVFSKKPEEGFDEYDFFSLTPEDIVVFDSWTAISDSIHLMFALRNSLDISDAEDRDWPGYRWARQFASWVLSSLHSLPCHVIVISHVNEYEKTRKNLKTKKTEIVFTRTQPVSVSAPHAMQMAKDFSDVFRFYLHNASVKIDATSTKDADGGSRIVKPGIYNWNELSFEKLLKGLDQ